MEDGRALTSSLDVAAYFGKKHMHVLEAIDTLRAQAPEALSNFRQGSYTLPATGAQQHRYFEMDRDAFTLLAMGFTGRDALQFKLAYIAAFNALEATLTSAGVQDPGRRALIQALQDQDRLECEQRRQAVAQTNMIATQVDHGDRLLVIETKQSAQDTALDYYTVVGFARRIGQPVNHEQALRIGTLAGKASRDKGLPIGKVRDQRYGSVNTYHESVLLEAFAQVL
jgi:Rha family phage regulatory protein